MIKGIIDLYRAEAFRIVVKHFLGRDLFRIEFPFPCPVRVTACADTDLHVSLRFATGLNDLQPVYLPACFGLPESKNRTSRIYDHTEPPHVRNLRDILGDGGSEGLSLLC